MMRSVDSGESSGQEPAVPAGTSTPPAARDTREQCPSSKGTEYATRTPPKCSHLGVREHTDEDCRVSEVLYLALGAPVVAEGTAVYVLREAAWIRYRITAAIDAASSPGIWATWR